MLPSRTKQSQDCNHSAKQLTIKRRCHRFLHKALKNQNYKRAIDLLTYLITQEPHNAIHYKNRGRIYHHCRKWKQALVDYNQAVQLNPKGTQIYFHRAKCNAALGRWHESITDYDCAIDINPNNIQARINQGILFRELKMYDDAIVCFGLALFIGKLSAHIYAERGRTYHLDGHWNCAIGDYQRALSRLEHPHNEPLVLKLKAWMSELLKH